jgi:hypothetical protein
MQTRSAGASATGQLLYVFPFAVDNALWMPQKTLSRHEKEDHG